MISVQNLCKKFGNLTVLKEIDLQVRSGEVVCIIGPSGSGKSTLLRCINLLESPTHGKIRIGNVELVFGEGNVKERMKRELRNKTGMVFQNFHLFPHKTVLENVIEGPFIVKKEPLHQLIPKAESLLEKVGLMGKKEVYPDQLSGGQQQRVAIARAMAMEPEILLLDEPTSALDPELIGEVLLTIRELAQERQTMIIVTHEMSFARDVADRIIFMDDGKIIEEGKPDELFQNPKEDRTRQFLAEFIDSKGE